jgi:hypothetical protein
MLRYRRALHLTGRYLLEVLILTIVGVARFGDGLVKKVAQIFHGRYFVLG